MKDLEIWMDEYYLEQLWNYLCNGYKIKITITKKSFNNTENNAYIEFETEEKTKEIYIKYNRQLIPGTITNKYFQLYLMTNHQPSSSSYPLSSLSSTTSSTNTSTSSSSSLVNQHAYPLYIHHLPLDCNEFTLWPIFKPKYPSCQLIKMIKDPYKNHTLGIIYFHHKLDQQLAFKDMQHKLMFYLNHHQHILLSLNLHPTSLSPSFLKEREDQKRSLPYQLNHHSQQQQQNDKSEGFPLENTTIFIGGLSTPLKEEELKQYFTPFGKIIYVKIPPGKGCGFVQYVSRSSAESAMKYMNGYQIGQSRIRIYWGKSQYHRDSTSSSNHPSPSSYRSLSIS
ncbi:unnamed protein product [Cunninghamella blakesleeana]